MLGVIRRALMNPANEFRYQTRLYAEGGFFVVYGVTFQTGEAMVRLRMGGWREDLVGGGVRCTTAPWGSIRR